MLDFLFHNPKSLSKEKLDRMLRQISALSPEEREYVKNVFGKYASGGISKMEAERVIRELKLRLSDSLESHEVEKIKEKILGFFN